MTEIVDKRAVLPTLSPASPVVIELGCGPRKSVDGAIGVDALDTDAVDIVGDALSVLRRVPDGCVRRVHSSHFLEHVDDLDGFVREISRVLCAGGVMTASVPHFSNPYFYSDPTHRRTFGLYTFAYFAECSLFARAVPRYGRDFGFRLTDATLGFDSPFALRRLFKRAFGAVANLSRYTQEFYEENLCQVFPCYELRVTLEKRASP